MAHEFEDDLEDLSPLELVKATDDGLEALKDAPQIVRDRFINLTFLMSVAQHAAAVELRDPKAADDYAMAGEFMTHIIARKGDGGTFTPAGELGSHKNDQ